jgi:hypothetical protein
MQKIEARMTENRHFCIDFSQKRAFPIIFIPSGQKDASDSIRYTPRSTLPGPQAARAAGFGFYNPHPKGQ